MGNTCTAIKEVSGGRVQYIFLAADEQAPWRYPRVSLTWELHNLATELRICQRITQFRLWRAPDQMLRVVIHLEEIIIKLVGILYRIWRLLFHLAVMVDEVTGRAVEEVGLGVPMFLELTERVREVIRPWELSFGDQNNKHQRSGRLANQAMMLDRLTRPPPTLHNRERMAF